MTFFTGHGDPNSPDFYIEEFRGMYISEDGGTWGNKPFTKNQRMYDRIYNHCAMHLRTFRDEYDLVMQKKSTLSADERAYLINIIENGKEGDVVV
jgi:hypothetical protein